MIEIAFLGSGSSGNCAVIRSGGTTVLLDAGLSMRETKRRLRLLDVEITEVSAVFLTHEHADHMHGAATLVTKLDIPVFATAGTLALSRLPGPLFADERTVEGGVEVRVGELHVRVTETPHDGIESVCYTFTDGDGRRVGVVTDLGHLSRAVIEALADCEVIGLEANHDVDLLRAGPYPFVLKQRILSDVGHLSNEAAAFGLRRLVGGKTKSVVALHVSKQNNTPSLARQVFAEAIEEIGASVTLDVARPDQPLGFLSV
ncbi:MAG TPA: MBL fold metallo-hydrolase [Thermoanaerobaculia bacterium]|nr:MBL fold metallo-hydrolase [Thermoanaerobaculia bacterium]